LYLSNDDLNQLDTFAKRIRGEILFARAWLLCEGQSEYLLLRYFAELRDKPLDRAGVAVIDFQNNGSPGAFVGLARAFAVPWIMVCDSDNEGLNFIKQVKNRGLTTQECNELVRPLPGNEIKLEKFLVNNGFINDYREILKKKSIQLTANENDAEFEDAIISIISKDKMSYTIALIERLRATGADGSRVPQFFQTVIDDIVAKGAS